MACTSIYMQGREIRDFGEKFFCDDTFSASHVMPEVQVEDCF